MAGYFGHTRSFAYALTADSGPIQPHTLLSGPSASSLAKDRKLYYSLGDIAYYTHPPPASPECRCNATSPPEPLRTCLHGSSTTAEAIPIFPNLKTATFDPLPASDSQDVIASSRTLQRQTPFLSQVETVILQHTPGTPHDNAPNFYILGLTSVKTLHLHHLLGAEVNFSFDVSRYLGFQSELSTVYFHVANHARYVLGDTNHDTPAGRSETAQDRIHGDVVDMDLSPDQPLDTPAGTTPAANDRHRQNDRDFFWYMSEYVDALARGISRLIHRRTPGGPHSRRRTASLPALQTIVVELPWSPPAATSANASSITHAQSDRTGGALRQNEQNLLLTAKASILDTFQWDEVEGIPPPPDNTIVQVRLEDGQAWNLVSLDIAYASVFLPALKC